MLLIGQFWLPNGEKMSNIERRGFFQYKRFVSMRSAVSKIKTIFHQRETPISCQKGLDVVPSRN